MAAEQHPSSSLGDPASRGPASPASRGPADAAAATPLLRGRHETEKERLDRNLNELLSELRVALPGVQVLFAFLLAVPFQQRFARVSTLERTDYIITLLLAAIACALLIAPSAYHRIQFHRDDKAHLLVVANRCALVGFGFLALAMTGVVLLVISYLTTTLATVLITAAVATMFVTLWYLLPLRRHLGRRAPRERAIEVGQ